MGHMPTLQFRVIIRVGAKRKIGTQREAFGRRLYKPSNNRTWIVQDF
jgi:hypothetical protein